jgi:hypothetical protein
MSQPAPNTRRVVLPSGRTIEVVYFDGSDLQSTTTHRGRDLHVCPACDKTLVHPVEWEEASPAAWRVRLRCPNCEWQTVGVFDQATMDRFDALLDEGTDALMRDLKRLTRANMEEEAERFQAALASDAIWPMDF